MNKKNLIFILTLSQIIYTNTRLSQRDLLKDISCCCCCKPIPPTSCQGRHLVFTAPDINKNGQNPDTSFSGIYTGSNIKLQAWRLKPSNEGQQEISLIFGMPDDYDATCPLTIIFYLVVEQNAGSKGNNANIRIRQDNKTTMQEIGPNFTSTYSTGNFIITEPSTNKTLENIIVSTTLTPIGIAPGDWVLLVLDRINTVSPEIEYSKNIYLTGIVIKYGS